ncbi:hypothetical protein [Bdellovibrio sp. BCCA]|uniref:hypothetical protein n=1 Tax=Bdellovibrio sp. BCCA TaxID=3136281 RepID=UPI0030F297A3
MAVSSRILVIYKNRKQLDPFLEALVTQREKVFLGSMTVFYRFFIAAVKVLLGWSLLPKCHRIDTEKSVPRTVDDFDLNDLIILDNVSMIESMELQLLRQKISKFTTIEVCRYEEAALIIGSQPKGTYRRTMLLAPELGNEGFYDNDPTIHHMAEKWREKVA